MVKSISSIIFPGLENLKKKCTKPIFSMSEITNAPEIVVSIERTDKWIYQNEHTDKKNICAKKLITIGNIWFHKMIICNIKTK